MKPYSNVKSLLGENQFVWLITGVAGFIGSHLLEALLALDQKVIGIDNFSTGSKQNLLAVKSIFPERFQRNFTLRKGDICSPEFCHEVIQDVDFILHQAAAVSVPASIESPDYTHAINVTGFMNILNAARKTKVKRVVYASSSAVYGNTETLYKTESETPAPLSPYAVSKLTNELYAKNFGHCYGLETMGLRYFNVYGPRQNPSGAYAAVIPTWIIALLNNDVVQIYGDGSTVRDFCYVADIAQANLLAALTAEAGAINGVFNIASGQQTSLNELLDCLTLLIKPGKIQRIHNDFRKGDIKYSAADIAKAANILHYQPVYNIQGGLTLTIKFYAS